MSTDHYTIISADCHAGGSHEQYREYLDPAFRDEFDAWRNKYKNPYRDLHDGGRIRNWDDDRRNGDLEADGQVAEVIFPNTVPPFFPSFVLFAKPPTDEQFIKEHDLRGGLLLPNLPPDCTWVSPLIDPAYDRLWKVCEDLGVVINLHGGTGAPDYGKFPATPLVFISE